MKKLRATLDFWGNSDLIPKVSTAKMVQELYCDFPSRPIVLSRTIDMEDRCEPKGVVTNEGG